MLSTLTDRHVDEVDHDWSDLLIFIHGFNIYTHIYIYIYIFGASSRPLWRWWRAWAKHSREPRRQRHRRSPLAAAEAEAAERRRLQLAALGNMADAALEQSLERESVSLLRDEEAQIAQSYRAEIYELVRQNWSRPPSARNGMSARLLVELIPTGEVISVAVVEGSGNAAFDQAAEQAVRQARRFPVPDNNAQFERYFRRFYFLFQPEDLLR